MALAPSSYGSPAAQAEALCETSEAPDLVHHDAGAATQARAAGERLRSLLREDRRAAGESRDQAPLPPIAVSSYTTPLHVLWRRYFRAHRRELRKFATVLALALTAVALWQLWLFHAGAAAPKAGASAPKPLAADVPSVPGRARVQSGKSPDASGAAKLADLPADAEHMSTRKRLVRADALLRHPSQRAARQARALLELTLPAVPRDAHARASLAEACLRLADEQCARAAIAQALELRPRRSRYRALSEQVDRTFRN